MENCLSFDYANFYYSSLLLVESRQYFVEVILLDAQFVYEN